MEPFTHRTTCSEGSVPVVLLERVAVRKGSSKGARGGAHHSAATHGAVWLVLPSPPAPRPVTPRKSRSEAVAPSKWMCTPRSRAKVQKVVGIGDGGKYKFPWISRLWRRSEEVPGVTTTV